MVINVWSAAAGLCTVVITILHAWDPLGFAKNKTGRNEARKLTAGALNNIAVGLFLGGLIIPSMSRALEPVSLEHLQAILDYAPVFFLAVIAHINARMIVHNLEE